jgi:ABC-type dipeptide/oligopeptide/nickel transport system permease subunit
MAKRYTPAMARFEKKNKGKKSKISSPSAEAWKRLRRNRLALVGLVVVVLMILMAIFAPVIAPQGYDNQNYAVVLQKPSSEYPLGTDDFGRDLLTRLIYGSRISVPVGFICSALSLLVGGGLGLIAAYYGGTVEDVIMRIMDIFMAIPAMLFAMAVLSAIGTGTFKMIMAISLSTLPLFARITRGAVYTVKSADYIDSSRAIGASNTRMMLRHMLPNALGPIIVVTTFGVASNILIVSSLSYLGVGIVPPTAEWGSILSAAKTYISSAPWFLIFPGITIMLAVFALNLFGDGVRDALDPRLK